MVCVDIQPSDAPSIQHIFQLFKNAAYQSTIYSDYVSTSKTQFGITWEHSYVRLTDDIESASVRLHQFLQKTFKFITIIRQI